MEENEGKFVKVDEAEEVKEILSEYKKPNEVMSVTRTPTTTANEISLGNIRCFSARRQTQ